MTRIIEKGAYVKTRSDLTFDCDVPGYERSISVKKDTIGVIVDTDFDRSPPLLTIQFGKNIVVTEYDWVEHFENKNNDKPLIPQSMSNSPCLTKLTIPEKMVHSIPFSDMTSDNWYLTIRLQCPTLVNYMTHYLEKHLVENESILCELDGKSIECKVVKFTVFHNSMIDIDCISVKKH